jgi:aldose 1-epimerase
MRIERWLVAGSAVLCGCGGGGEERPSAREFAASYFEIHREDFQGEVDGRAVDLYTIENAQGAFAKITNLGAKIEQIVVPDRAGRFGDVVLGYPSLETVQTGQASMGAFMGRYANRIAGDTFVVDGVERKGGSFELEGETFTLPANDGARPNTSHGGAMGARYRVFEATQLSGSSLKMSLTFADGEDAEPGFTGFPGTVALEVVYTMTEENALGIRYRATALDKTTVINLTSHPFFNLSNTPGSVVEDHVVTLHAEQFLELDEMLIPTGVLREVEGTPMDFRAGKPVGADIGDVSYDMLARIDPMKGGYDHTFAISQSAKGAMTLHATVVEPASGRVLEVRSTEPGLQFFTANGLNGQAPRDVGKGDTPYPSRSALCLEPMHFPDSPNQPSFPSTTLAKGATYEGEIVFAFGVQ